MRDMEKRKPGDWIRQTMQSIPQAYQAEKQSPKETRAEFRAAPSWVSPLEESDDDIVKAGREHGKNILEDKFNYGYLAGWDDITDSSSPIGNSTYLDIARENANDHAKADFAAGVGAGAELAAGIKMNTDEMGMYTGAMELSAYLIDKAQTGLLKKGVGKILKRAAPISGLAYTVADGGLQDAASTYQYLSENNARAKQSDRQYEYLSNSELKYLVDDKNAREKFVNALEAEVANLQNTEQLGFLPPGINETYKQEAINSLMRVIFLNQNYDKYRAERDLELRRLLSEE